MIPPVGVVLAGGESRRMGTDKAFVHVGGRAMVRRVADALVDGGCRPVVCQGGDGARAARHDLGTWPDLGDPSGPVGAIRSALRRSVDEMPDVDLVVVAACDLPMLDGSLIGSLVSTAMSSGKVAVASTGGRLHLVAAWPVSFTSIVDRLAATGTSSFRHLIGSVPSVEVLAGEAVLLNVNRPTDVPGRVTTTGSTDVGSLGSDMSTDDISVDELAERLAEGARLIDVREPDEFDEVRIAGSVLVPLRTVPDNVDSFRGEGPVYVMCRAGGRSLQACDYLRRSGLEVVNVEGGILAWIASGRDVVTGPA